MHLSKYQFNRRLVSKMFFTNNLYFVHKVLSHAFLVYKKLVLKYANCNIDLTSKGDKYFFLILFNKINI